MSLLAPIHLGKHSPHVKRRRLPQNKRLDIGGHGADNPHLHLVVLQRPRRPLRVRFEGRRFVASYVGKAPTASDPNLESGIPREIVILGKADGGDLDRHILSLGGAARIETGILRRPHQLSHHKQAQTATTQGTEAPVAEGRGNDTGNGYDANGGRKEDVGGDSSGAASDGSNGDGGGAASDGVPSSGDGGTVGGGKEGGKRKRTPELQRRRATTTPTTNDLRKTLFSNFDGSDTIRTLPVPVRYWYWYRYRYEVGYASGTALTVPGCFFMSQVSLLPPLASIAVTSIAATFADTLISNGVETTVVRKICQTIAFICPALSMSVASMDLGMSPWEIVAFLTAGLSLSSFALSGLYCTHQDISPEYASILLGITNTVGAVPGIVGVALAGYLIDQTHSWSVALFLPSIFFYLTGTAVWVAFASSKPQTFVKGD
ncbi:putative anion transporter 6 [Nymphaea thermarum]|nr:putative anion transporter 6 [Nymphaea thermarum]